MAEVLGTVASGIAVAQAAGALMTLSKEILSVAKTVKTAPGAIQAIADRIGALESVLKKLKDTADLADPSDDSADGLADLCAPRGPLANCRKCLEKIEDLLPSKSDTRDDTRGVRKAFFKLKLGVKWTLRSSEVTAILNDVDRHQTDILSHLALATHNQARKTKKHVYSMSSKFEDKQRRDYYIWLEKDFKDYEAIQIKWRDTREKFTCIWILRKVEWKTWLSGKSAHRLLWISGLMGTGKTILMSFIVDRFKNLYRQGHKTAMAYYYCHHTHNRNESEPFLRCILGQLCRHIQSVPCSLVDCFRDDLFIDVEQILVAIEECLTELEVVYIVLDALDESLPCRPLLAVIKRLTQEDRFSKIRLVSSSRPETVIEESLEPASTMIRLTNLQVGEDIKRHIASTLRSEEFSWWSAGLKSDVAQAVSFRASGMFRLATAQLDLLSRLTTEAEVRGGLETLPDTIYDSYDRILLTLSKEQRAVVVGVLVMLYYSGGSASFHQISAMPRILAASTRAHESSNGSAADDKTIRRWCGSLVSIHAAIRAGPQGGEGAETDGNSEQETLDISHRSVFEYLTVYLERERLETKQDFAVGVLRLCASSRALPQDHNLLESLMRRERFNSLLDGQTEIRSAYYYYLRSDLSRWLSDLFDSKIADGNYFFSEVYMPMRKHILWRLLCIFWKHQQHHTIQRCCRSIGFSSLLETAITWDSWGKLGISNSSNLSPDAKAILMILIHDGGTSCGESCHLQFKPVSSTWNLTHVVFAMACLDYEAITEITKRLYSSSFTGFQLLLIGTIVRSGMFPNLSQVDLILTLRAGGDDPFVRVLRLYGYLSSVAVFSETERKTWEDIGRLLSKKRSAYQLQVNTIAEEPSSTDAPAQPLDGPCPPDEGERLIDSIPHRTEEQTETLKKELDDYVNETIDKLATCWE